LEDVLIVSVLQELKYALETTTDANKCNMVKNFLRTLCSRTDADPYDIPYLPLVTELLDGTTNLLIWRRGKGIIDCTYTVYNGDDPVGVSVQVAPLEEVENNAPGYEELTKKERQKLLAEVRKADKLKGPRGAAVGAVWGNILQLLKKFVYLQTTICCSPSDKIGVLMRDLWRHCTGGLWSEDSSQNKHDSVLMMLGVKGCGTPFHHDWSNAVNVAFALSDLTMHSILAVWSFLHPSVLLDEELKGYFDEWCKMNLQKYCLEEEEPSDLRLFNQEVTRTPSRRRPRRPLLTMSDMTALNTHLADRSNRPNFQFIIHLNQRHGDVMQVCVGWSHQVINTEECWKYAFDFAAASDAMQCVHINNLMHTLYPGVNAPDYRCITEEAADWTKKSL
jgi:hypothetical protein